MEFLLGSLCVDSDATISYQRQGEARREDSI